MTRRAPIGVTIAALLVVIACPTAMRAQGNPPPRPVVTPPPASTAAVVAPTPPDSAVALCNDGTWVKEPHPSADCASRGGLRVAMPPRVKAPPAPTASSASLNIAPTRAATLTAPPSGATMHCKDGTYLFGAPSEARCAQNGGLAAILPVPPPPPPAPRRP